MKQLTEKDLVIGKKYVPHSKSVGVMLEYSVWRQAKSMSQPYIYYKGLYNETEHTFDFEDNGEPSGDFFLPSDVTEYIEPKTTDMNYTEKPFDLETALKHPEWVVTRAGIKVQYLKKYATLLAVICESGIAFNCSYGGKIHPVLPNQNDLILRVPERTVYVALYKHCMATWSTEKEVIADNDLIHYFEVKIPCHE